MPDGSEHPGCKMCYAQAGSLRNPKLLGEWGLQGTRVKAAEPTWRAPLTWNAKAAQTGDRHRVFCASIADVFEDWQGPIHDHHGGVLGKEEAGGNRYKVVDGGGGDWPVTMDDLRRDLFALIDDTPWLDWLLLTKRPQNIRRMWSPHRDARKRDNIWLGTSVSDQATANILVPGLLECRELAPVLFLSVEPLLGPITLDRTDIDWVIVGGESGPHARQMQPEWARSLRDQCQAAGVPFFFKQWGEWSPEPKPGTSPAPTESGMYRIGKQDAGRLLDGCTWDEFPVLKALAETIRTQHIACEKAMGESLKHAMIAGAALLEAKKEIAHGQFLAWVETNCDFSFRTAQQYMQLAKNKGQISNAQRAAHLSQRDAAALISKPRAKPDRAKPENTFSVPAPSRTTSDAVSIAIPTHGRSIEPSAATPVKPVAARARTVIEKMTKDIEATADKLHADLIANAKLAAGELLNKHGCSDDEAVDEVYQLLFDSITSRFNDNATTGLAIEAA